MKLHLNPQFVALLNEHADVVADDLAQHLVDHRHRGLATHVIAGLGLDRLAFGRGSRALELPS